MVVLLTILCVLAVIVAKIGDRNNFDGTCVV